LIHINQPSNSVIAKTARFNKAIEAFDGYNSKDINLEMADGVSVPKELLYAQRMSKKLLEFSPEASECLQLAARCQHIGRWEISRSNYPMDKKGYFQWRNAEKIHHANIARTILKENGYEDSDIDKVVKLLVKEGLHSNIETQTLEDVVCLVFLEYYLEDFAKKHEDDKIVDIIRKTMKKMSQRGIESASSIPLSPKSKALLHEAATKS